MKRTGAILTSELLALVVLTIGLAFFVGSKFKESTDKLTEETVSNLYKDLSKQTIPPKEKIETVLKKETFNILHP